MFRYIICEYLKNHLPLITIDGVIEIDVTFLGAVRRGSIGRTPKKHHTIFGSKISIIMTHAILIIRSKIEKEWDVLGFFSPR